MYGKSPKPRPKKIPSRMPGVSPKPRPKPGMMNELMGNPLRGLVKTSPAKVANQVTGNYSSDK